MLDLVLGLRGKHWLGWCEPLVPSPVCGHNKNSILTWGSAIAYQGTVPWPIYSKKCSFGISKVEMLFAVDNVLAVVCSHGNRKVVAVYVRLNTYQLPCH